MILVQILPRILSCHHSGSSMCCHQCSLLRFHEHYQLPSSQSHKRIPLPASPLASSVIHLIHL